jgi:RNA polymerase sigma-32 factor
VAPGDALGTYLRQLGAHPPLEREEEHAVAVEFVRTRRADLRHRLVSSQLRLVVKIARERCFGRLDLLDLIAQGNLGLLVAVERFDPTREVRLSTYASWWIRALINGYLNDNRRLVRVGSTREQRHVISQLARVRGELERQGRGGDLGLLAGRLGVDADSLAVLQHHLDAGEVRLDAPLDEAGHTGVELLRSREEAPDASFERAEESTRVRQVLAEFLPTLDRRDRQLLAARWGDGEPPTLQEMGRRFGITRERARQLEARLLARLRDFAAPRLRELAAAA